MPNYCTYELVTIELVRAAEQIETCAALRLLEQMDAQEDAARETHELQEAA
jgi:hypothetical protein